jgi:serine/threonine protein kinase
MKRVKHESIVRLFDVFEIDDDSFCTVLELCDGNDLDAHIKVRQASAYMLCSHWLLLSQAHSCGR